MSYVPSLSEIEEFLNRQLVGELLSRSRVNKL